MDTNRNEVIIPGYTCPSVAAAVIKSGLKVRLCDIRKDGFDLDLGQLEKTINSNTLCVVSVHLFGIPSNILSIKKMLEGLGIALVEDAAQALGINLNDKALGTIGDIGFYSFGRGKPLTLLGGGAIVTNSHDYAEKIKGCVNSLGDSSVFCNLKWIMNILSYSVLVHPEVYFFPNSIPFLRLGETLFSLNFHMTKISKVQAALLMLLLPENNRFNLIRIQNARYLIERLSHITHEISLVIPGVETNVSIPYLRLPLIFRHSETRNKILMALVGKGIMATRMYPVPLNLMRSVKPYLDRSIDLPNARWVADRIMTLPVHPYVTELDLKRTVSTFCEEFT